MRLQDKLKELSQPLSINDIDWRVSQAKESNKGAWAMLLGYKTARVDAKRLDEVVGPNNWKTEYEYRTKLSSHKTGQPDGSGSVAQEYNIKEHSVLFCRLSIWDDEKQQWVTKEDVGTESFSDADKGEASDSFKRAGFKWGIGTELYDLPTIFCGLNKNEYYTQGNKVRTTARFRPNDWYWKLDWDHKGEHGSRGLIWAKETKSQKGAYRVKPTSIFKGENHIS